MKDKIANALDKSKINFEGDKCKALDEIHDWALSNSCNSKATRNVKTFESIKDTKDNIDFTLSHAGKDKKRKIYVRRDGRVIGSEYLE